LDRPEAGKPAAGKGGGLELAARTQNTSHVSATNHRAAQAFANAIVKALRWLERASVEEIVAAVPAEYYSGGDRATYAKMVELNRGAFSKDGRIDLKAAENTYRALAAHEEVLKNAKVDLKDTFDNTFVDKAAAAAR